MHHICSHVCHILPFRTCYADVLNATHAGHNMFTDPEVLNRSLSCKCLESKGEDFDPEGVYILALICV